MDFRVRLVHAEGQARVVLAQAFEGERLLGSALGEASSAEEAEDRAIQRLRQRLRVAPSPALPSTPRVQPSPAPQALPASAPPATPSPVPPAAPSATLPMEDVPPPEAPSDPEDWGADLLELDRLLRQLGWGRDEESVYLRRLFGQPSRSRLTRYADLMLLRRALEGLPPGSQPGTAPLPLVRSELLAQCDELLAQLTWTTDQARQALERHFAVHSRQRLSDDQLLAFNVLLEGELLALSPSG